MEVNRTTFEVEGCKEPCIEVTDGFSMVRIHKCYHYFGHNTTYVTEYVDGEFNSREEIDRHFESITDAAAIKLAKEFCVYLN